MELLSQHYSNLRPGSAEARAAEESARNELLTFDEDTVTAIDPELSESLRLYAREAAQRAVRENDPIWSASALRAICLSARGHADERELVLVMALAYDSLERTAVLLHEMFEESISDIVDPPGFVTDFPNRPASQRELGEFGYRAEGSGSSFTYEQNIDPALTDRLIRLARESRK